MSNLLNPDWDRRKFMRAILTAAVAPAIVRAESLMPIWTPGKQIILPASEIEVVNEAWLEFLDGAVMSGGSSGDIARGLCVPHKRGGVTFMGYRFPGARR